MILIVSYFNFKRIYLQGDENISRDMIKDKQKLLKIINELKQDYEDDKISKDKYDSLLKSYEERIQKIDTTLRIKKMRGEEEVDEEDFDLEDNKLSEKNDSEISLADKHIVKTKQPVKKLKRRQLFVPFVIILLAVAFVAGAIPGFLEFPQLNTKDTNTLQISENAFPINMIKNTPKQDYTEESTSTEKEYKDDGGGVDPNPIHPDPQSNPNDNSTND